MTGRSDDRSTKHDEEEGGSQVDGASRDESAVFPSQGLAAGALLPGSGRAGRTLLLTLAAFLLGCTVLGSISFRLPGPVEADGYFHLAIARDYASGSFAYQTLIEEGPLAQYHADREVLFHALLALFLWCGITPALCAALMPALVGGLLAAILYLHSRSWWVVLVGLFASTTFLYRLLMCRPHGLAVVLVLAGLACLLSRRYRAAALVNLVYTWSYSVPVLIAGAAIFECIERRQFRPLLWILGASAIGWLVHPHFPDNLYVLWYQGGHVATAALTTAPESALASELQPWQPLDLLLDAWVPVGLFVTALVTRRRGLPTWFLVFSFLLLAMTLRSMRFIEYWAPVVALGSAGTIAYLLAPTPPRMRWIIFVLFVAARPTVAWFLVDAKAREVAPTVAATRAAAVHLREAARGDRVLNVRWDTYAVLRYFGGTFGIAEGHDPLFFPAYDKDRWRHFQRFRQGRMSLEEYRKHINYRWIITPTHSPLTRWARHHEVPVEYEDDAVRVLRIDPTPKT